MMSRKLKILSILTLLIPPILFINDAAAQQRAVPRNVVTAAQLKHKEEADWAKARTQNTVEAFRNFLALYPRSKYRDEAVEMLKYKEKDDWSLARSQNTVEALRKFLTSYPRSEYRDAALDALKSLRPPIFQAAFDRNLTQLTLQLSDGVNVNTEWDNLTPLMAASREGWLEGVKVLVEHGADINRITLEKRDARGFIVDGISALLFCNSGGDPNLPLSMGSVARDGADYPILAEFLIERMLDSGPSNHGPTLKFSEIRDLFDLFVRKNGVQHASIMLLTVNRSPSNHREIDVTGWVPPIIVSHTATTLFYTGQSFWTLAIVSSEDGESWVVKPLLAAFNLPLSVTKATIAK
jgi:hypothetical protein